MQVTPPASRSSVNLFTTPLLDAATCRRIRAAMDAGNADSAEVLDADYRVEAAVRRTLSIEVDDATLATVEHHLETLRPLLAAHFATALGTREGAGFLRYTAGGFYRRHRDRADDSPWPDAARRQIAVVLFLNGSRAADAAGAFAGGALRLLPDDPAAAPIDLHPREGIVVAFAADTLHEVTTVTAGTRDTVVDWFY